LRSIIGSLVALFLFTTLTGACAAQEVKVMNWEDYIAPGTNAGFTQATGIAVRYSTFNGADEVEPLLKHGNSGQDVVVATDDFLHQGIPTAKFQKLDKAKLPNLATLDPLVMRATEAVDPGHLYAVPYFWGTVGIGINLAMVQARLGAEMPSSWALIFDPKNAAKLADCGIAMLDAPADVIQAMLIYLGRDPNTDRPEDYAAAEQALKAIRPFVREFHSWKYVADLPRNKLCAVLGWNGDVIVARKRAEEAKTGADIRFFTPREGAMIWADNLAIPVDAPHPDAALAYINHLLDAQVAADNAATTGYASPMSAELRAKLIPATVRDDRSIYPDVGTIAKLHGAKTASAALNELREATWARVKAAP